jgi:hypothetical protein
MAFTETEKKAIQEAAHVNIVEYCVAVGIPLVPFSGDTYRHAEFDSLKITGWEWKRHSGRHNGYMGYTKGNAIHFVREYEKLGYWEAVMKLLEVSKSPLLSEIRPSVKAKLWQFEHGQKPKVVAQEQAHTRPNVPVEKEKPEPKPEKEKKSFELPPKNTDNKRVIAYLTKTRGIDHEIVNHMIKHGSLYEEAEHHNCVFVGYDKDQVARYAGLRGTYTQTDKPTFKGEVEGGKKRFGWCFTPETESPLLRVYESPIDAMSHMSAEKLAGGNWRNKHYLSLGALAYEALPEYLKNHPEIKSVSFCLDNDIAGRQKTEEYSAKLEKQGYSCTAWQKVDTMTLCSFGDQDGVLRFLEANPQIRNLSFQVKPEDHVAAEEMRQLLAERRYTCIENNKEPKLAKDFNEALQLKKKQMSSRGMER